MYTYAKPKVEVIFKKQQINRSIAVNYASSLMTFTKLPYPANRKL